MWVILLKTFRRKDWLSSNSSEIFAHVCFIFFSYASQRNKTIHKNWKAIFFSNRLKIGNQICYELCRCTIFLITSFPNQVICCHIVSRLCFCMFFPCSNNRTLFCNLIGKLTVPDILRLMLYIVNLLCVWPQQTGGNPMLLLRDQESVIYVSYLPRKFFL